MDRVTLPLLLHFVQLVISNWHEIFQDFQHVSLISFYAMAMLQESQENCNSELMCGPIQPYFIVTGTKKNHRISCLCPNKNDCLHILHYVFAKYESPRIIQMLLEMFPTSISLVYIFTKHV